MKTRDQKKNQYGTFSVAKHGYQKIKTAAGLYALVAVLILGIGGLIYKQFNKPKPQPVAASVQAASVLPNWWLLKYFGSSVCNSPDCQPNADPDHDGLTNAQEYFYHTDPNNAFSVKDTLNDGQLVAAGFDPSRPGRVPFDQVASDPNVMGESLVLNDDVKQLVAQTQDISKVNIPLVQDSELKIDYSGSTASYQTYLTTLQTTVNKYFPQSQQASIVDSLKNSSGPDIENIDSNAVLLVSDLKAMTVPAKFLSFHKDYIALYQLMPDVVSGVADSTGTVSTSSDAWYDKAQAFLAVQQKLSFEKELLSKQFAP